MDRFRVALLYGTLAAAGFVVVTGVVTGLLPTPLFERMVPRTALDYTFFAVTAVLVGVYVTQRSMQPDCDGDACAYGGAAGGFLAVACPHCNAILVALFSSSWLATYVDPVRPLVGLLAVGLLAGVIYRRR
ncbi:hypothetical protein [Natrarchaeobaculum sulfurireducens]|uniref:Uncharacterized protein n=1 Tax=Natrarchaeobaculum sulfurireducens TaxID=2044521 RepID=A0A346PQN1_9EURY|nr:hypothetical protein [Natrarchaeobaculum sulfurireducens]AXR78187.1 hypothetical protein AArc1_1864 [Natrarchaeobaculum sulfurireducens]AXR81826.1 hypothetical protein AArcMg_1819 [Natrarchaeobaculum sulfurireducens]